MNTPPNSFERPARRMLRHYPRPRVLQCVSYLSETVGTTLRMLHSPPASPPRVVPVELPADTQARLSRAAPATPGPPSVPPPSSRPRRTRRNVVILDTAAETASFSRAHAHRNAATARREAPPRPIVRTTHATDRLDRPRRRRRRRTKRARRTPTCSPRRGAALTPQRRLSGPRGVCPAGFVAIRGGRARVGSTVFISSDTAKLTKTRGAPPSRAREPRHSAGALAGTPPAGSAVYETRNANTRVPPSSRNVQPRHSAGPVSRPRRGGRFWDGA
ncbi:hypothetical protein VTO73DRAFT_7726 [Trametes versicolor]